MFVKQNTSRTNSTQTYLKTHPNYITLKASLGNTLFVPLVMFHSRFISIYAKGNVQVHDTRGNNEMHVN